MKVVLTQFILLAATTVSYASEHRISKSEYVDQWATVAVEQMIAHDIPASITLAQGILESASGNSDLATKGNNHFGIKCHDWTGKKMFKDDDKKNECFRVYSNAQESFEDHSDFLTGRSRYAELFSLDQKDYKGWAKGLKKAGYATNPKYPELLINLIEELELYKYDNMQLDKELPIAKAEKKLNKDKSKESKEVVEVVIDNTASSSSKRQVLLTDRRVKYVVAKKGDTYYRIAREYGMSLRQLYKYNDFSAQKDVLKEGDRVYIHPKKNRAKVASKTYNQNMSASEIAQIEGVKLKKLMKLNGFSSNQIIVKGEKVILR